MSNVCLKRLQKELVAIQKEPVQHISTTPNETNLLEWHYVIEGPQGSVYEGGYYHGILRFPRDYPYKPPSILMLTKNGRFRPNFRLCLSMSDYHPETWNPMWSVSSILQGLLSFMLDSQSTLGSIEATDEARRQFARLSMKENLQNATFCRLFPKYVNMPPPATTVVVVEEESAAAAPKKKQEEEVQPPVAAAVAAGKQGENPPVAHRAAPPRAATNSRFPPPLALLAALAVVIVALAVGAFASRS